MTPTQPAVDRLLRALRLETPLIAVYAGIDEAALAPTIEAKGRNCCFTYFDHWTRGTTLVIRKSDDPANPQHGCHGAQTSFGLSTRQVPWLANYLTDGVGAPAGEGLKATAQLAQECLDRRPAVPATGDAVFIGPLRLTHWPAVLSVTFFVDPDRLAAVSTLATYWSSDPEFVYAPFSSGCGLLWRELVGQTRPRAVIGGADVAARKYLPRDLLTLSVTPAHFARMLEFPDNCFLMKEWWNGLMDQRQRSEGRAGR